MMVPEKLQLFRRSAFQEDVVGATVIRQPFNAFSQVGDQEAAIIALGAVLRAVVERYPVDRERVEALIGAEAPNDGNMARRAAWFAEWLVQEQGS